MLKVWKARKQYKDFTLNCSMEVKSGRITGIVGQNGSGKSTMIKAALGLISLDEGEITILDKDSQEITAKEKQQVGAVFSDSGFSRYLNVKDILEILAHTYQAFDRAVFIKYLQKYHLPMDKKISEFSVGMKAKLKLIIALSHEAKFLILDEPTAGLDVIARDEMLDMLREYMEEDEERAILISSHISTDLETICDDIYMIDQGEIILHEDTDRLLSDYAVLKVEEEQMKALEKQYLLRIKKEGYGYACLTDQRQFYQENYPNIIIEKGNIDQAIMLMIQGVRP